MISINSSQDIARLAADIESGAFLTAKEVDKKDKFGMTAKDRREIYEVAITRSEEILNGEADDNEEVE